MISIWTQRLAQKTGGLFNNDQDQANEVPGKSGEMSAKDGLVDNSLLSDDFFDSLLPNPYDYVDTFPEAALETTAFGGENNVDSTSIAINFSEIMADLVNLMSLDKALADQDTGTSKEHNESSKPVSENDRKRILEEGLDGFWLVSSLPDHNYSSSTHKRQRTDDIPISNNTSGNESTSGTEDEHLPVRTKSSKYMERRKKNNIASKRSRETRKSRFQEMEVQANQLEEENEKLRQRIEKLEKLTQQMKEVLVNKLSNGR